MNTTSVLDLPKSPNQCPTDANLAGFRECDDAPVREYLRSHPHVVSILPQFRTEVSEHFGPNTAIALEMVNDQEGGCGLLYAVIKSHFGLEESLSRLDQFRDLWWLDAALEAQGDLHVDVENV